MKNQFNLGCCIQNSIWHKAFNITFDGFIRKYDWTKYLELFHSDEKYERIFSHIRHVIMSKSNNLDVNKYMEIKIKSVWSTQQKRTWTIFLSISNNLDITSNKYL